MTSSPDEPRVAGSAAARTEGLASVLSPHSPAIAKHPARVVRATGMPAHTPHVPTVIVGGGACGMALSFPVAPAGPSPATPAASTGRTICRAAWPCPLYERLTAVAQGMLVLRGTPGFCQTVVRIPEVAEA